MHPGQRERKPQETVSKALGGKRWGSKAGSQSCVCVCPISESSVTPSKVW